MASWKDGAAYAPIERPDGFATPVAPPLGDAEPPRAATPGPVAYPQLLEPDDAVPLPSLGCSEGRNREASAPFSVSSAAMTTMPLLAIGERDPRAPFQVSAPVRREATPPPPPPPPMTPLAIPAVPGAEEPLAPGQKSLVWLMAGLCAAGVVVPVAAPFLLIIAGVVSVLRVPWTMKIGAASMSVGGAFLLITLFLPGADTGLLFSLSSALVTAAFLIRAFSSTAAPGPQDWAPQEVSQQWTPTNPRQAGDQPSPPHSEPPG